MTDSLTTTRNWQRTSFRRADGSIDVAVDDWSLLDDAGQPLARIYHYAFGPHAGRWAWFVLVNQEGRPFNGGTGVAETGREAREECEKRVPEGVRMARGVNEAARAGT